MGVPFSADLGGFPMGKAVIEPWQAPIQLLSPIFFFNLCLAFTSSQIKRVI